MAGARGCAVVRRYRAVAVVALVCAVLAGAASFARRSGDRPRPAPATPVMFGAFTRLPGAGGEAASVRDRERALGRAYDLQLTYYDWRDPFPDYGEHAIAAQHRRVVMAWYGPGRHSRHPGGLTALNAGRDDAWIARQARAIKAFGHPVYLRPMIEMNGGWYEGYSQQPAAFIQAWRRIWRIFHRVGAADVTWVWCPNVTPAVWDPYYPGDRYVDVIGVDGYRTEHNGTAGASFGAIFGPFLRHFAGRKPVMLAEIGADPSGGDTAAYLTGLRRYLRTYAARQHIIAVCWFDTVDGRHDFRLDQTPATWSAWRALVTGPLGR